MEIDFLDFFTGPIVLTEKFQARSDRWITAETIHRHSCCEIVPANAIYQRNEDSFQGEAVERIVRLVLAHEV